MGKGLARVAWHALFSHSSPKVVCTTPTASFTLAGSTDSVPARSRAAICHRWSSGIKRKSESASSQLVDHGLKLNRDESDLGGVRRGLSPQSLYQFRCLLKEHVPRLGRRGLAQQLDDLRPQDGDVNAHF